MNDEVNRTQPLPDDVAIYLKKEEGGRGCTYGFLAPIVTLIDGWSWAWPGDIFLIVRIEKSIFFDIEAIRKKLANIFSPPNQLS